MISYLMADRKQNQQFQLDNFYLKNAMIYH